MSAGGRRPAAKQRETSPGKAGRARRAAQSSSSPGAPRAAQGSRRQVGFPVSTDLPLLRTSERSTMKQCEFLWDLVYNRRLKPETDAPALRFGSLVHKALAAWYVPGVKRGVHPAKAFEKAYRAQLAENETIFGMRVGEDEKWVNALELGLSMLNNYVDEYGQDEDWEVLATEMPFKVLVLHTKCRCKASDFCRCGHRGRGEEPWFWYTGIIDGLWRNRREKVLWIPDHKTTNQMTQKMKYLQMDDQPGSYWSFGVQYLREQGYLKPNQELAGMFFNFLRKQMPDERPSKLIGGKRQYLNQDGTVSKKQPAPYFSRLPIWRDEKDRAAAMHRAAIDMRRIELFRSGELEMSKTPGMFTCPNCGMRDACELHETGNDWEAFLAQTTKPWDPYAEHEVYDGR